MQKIPANRFEHDQIYFVSAAMRGRIPVFANGAAAQIALNALQFYRARKDIQLFGYIIMPDHIHLVLSPVAPLILPDFMRRYKNYLAHELALGSIWDKGYWSEVVVNEMMFWSRLKYLHENPLRKGLADRMADYPWTSALAYEKDELAYLIDRIQR